MTGIQTHTQMVQPLELESMQSNARPQHQQRRNPQKTDEDYFRLVPCLYQ